jgi:hypothetical protein
MTPFAIRNEQLRALLDHHWGREPALLAGALTAPLLSEQEIIGTLVDISPLLVCEPAEPGTQEEFSVRLFCDGRGLYDGATRASFIPDSRSMSLADYATAVSQRLGGAPFRIIINEFQLLCPPMWPRLRSLVRDLTDSLGVPPGRIEAVLSVGTQASSPYGIQRENGSMLEFVVRGERTTLYWRPEALPAGAWPTQIERLEASANKLTASVHDVTYWPPTYYRTDKNTNDQLQACVQIIVRSEEIKVADWIANHLRGLLGEHHAVMPFSKPIADLHQSELPAQLFEAWNRLTQLIESGAALVSLRRAFAEHQFSRALRDPPRRRPTTTSALQASMRTSVRWEAALEVSWSVGDHSHIGYTSNISFGGIYIADEAPPQVGTEVMIGINGVDSRSTSETSAVAAARVVYVDDNGFAVTFLRPRQEFLAAILKLAVARASDRGHRARDLR